MKDLPNLDLLRSVAVLLVVSSHLLLYTGHAPLGGWSGITGVCFFFVHTSLVLMWSLERDSLTARFYIRRIFRLYPLWIVVLVITVLFRVPTSPVVQGFGFFRPGAEEFVANVLLLFNLKFGARVVGASWSLPIEVDMYLVLPILFAFVRRDRQLWPLLLLDGFIMAFDRMQYPPTDARLPMCVPYFLPGIMAYVLYSNSARKRLPAWTFPLWLGLIVAVARSYGTFRGSWIVCLVLGLSLPYFHDITSAPLRRACHLVARYSYGIYLTHFMGIAVAVHLLHDYPVALRTAAFLAVVGGLSVGFYHLVEEPMIRIGSRLARLVQPGPAPRLNEAVLDLEPAP